MENLSLNDAAGGPAPQQDGNLGAGNAPAQGAPQLPPQMFTTAAQLLDLTDKKLMLVLRDGRKLIGVLRSWDQFANLVLADTVERYFVTVPGPTLAMEQAPGEERKLYCDMPRGTFLVRGENVLLLGEIDLDKDDDPPPGYELGRFEEVIRIQKEGEAQRKRHDKMRFKKAGESWGGELEASGEVLF